MRLMDRIFKGRKPRRLDKLAGALLNLSFTANAPLDQRITFGRTTNATVTDSQGLVKYAPHNLLTHSEQFDNADWVKTNMTATANSSVSPDGTLSADTLTSVSYPSTSASRVQTLTAAPYTMSVYAKASSLTSLRIDVVTSGFALGSHCIFNLSTQTATITNYGATTNSTASVIPVGNGWFRCVLTVTTTAANWFTQVYGAGDGSIIVWGAQLELGTTATTYNPTTVKNLLGYTEHFDNAAWTKSNAFVQTNLLTYSQDFTNAAWSKTGGSTASSANTLNFPSFGDVVSQATVMPASVGTSATFSVVLSGTGTTYIGAYRTAGGTYEQTIVQITLTSTPTRYSVTHTMVNAGQTGFGGYISRSTDGTATTVTATQAQLVNGTSAGDYKATYASAAAVGYPDIYGQPFAQKLVENTASSTHTTFQTTSTVAGSQYVFTAYLKAAEETTATLALSVSPFPRVKFDLTAGTIVSSQSGGTGTISAVGNGWYRCSILFTAPSTSGVMLIAVRDIDNNFTGDGTSGIYIFGAQLSDSASVDPYVYQPVAAPASTAYYGPRFDYDSVTLQPKGLLIEEQRTNLLTYSEQFDNAVWTKSNVTVSTNVIAAPDGTTTADKLVENTALQSHYVYRASVQISNVIAYAQSIYLKAGERTQVRIYSNVSGSYKWVVVDLLTGALTGNSYASTPSVQNVGNGWWRFSVAETSGSTSANLLYVSMLNNGSEVYTGDGTSGIYIWGAQLEAGAFATSYIPTVASQVTRAADTASMIGNNFARWYRQDEGTLFGEASPIATGSFGTFSPSEISNGNFDKRLFQSISGSVYRTYYQTPITSLNTSTAATVIFAKLATSYASTGTAMSASGGVVATTATVWADSVAANTLKIGATFASAGNNLVKRIAYFPRRLSNTELQGITQ